MPIKAPTSPVETGETKPSVVEPKSANAIVRACMAILEAILKLFKRSK